MKSAVNNPSAAGDLMLIFSLMKVLDPNSTVREGEFAQAQAAAGVSDRLRSHIGKVAAGERLTPEQRQDFLSQATRVFDAARAQYDEQAGRYRDLAAKIGGDPDDVVSIGSRGKSASPTSQSSVGAESLSPEDQAAIDWAKKNPNDPDAKAILKLHGM